MKIKQDNTNFIADRTKSGRDRYKLDGKPLTGVTTICNQQSKGFLVPWAAKEAYLHCLTLEPKEIRKVLREKTYAHTQKGKQATDKGTTAHDYVEKFVKGFIDTQKYIREVIEDEQVATSVYRFYDWAEEGKVEFFGSEMAVYSREYWYAGTFDFICKYQGKILMGDFKTSKQISNTYYAQGAGYAIAIEENNPEIKFDGVIIVRSILEKAGKIYYQKSSSGMAKKFQAKAFEVAISLDIERDKAYWLSLVNCYRYNRNLDVKEWHKAETVAEYPEEDYPID